MPAMFEKLSRAFGDITRSLSGKSSISEKNIEETVEQIKMALLEADVNLRVVRRFVNSTIEEAKGEKVLRSVSPGQMFVKLIHDKLVSFLGDQRADLALKGSDSLSVILLLGLQGSGKTTTAAKLALHLKGKGRRVLLAACDLVRPAAVEQLAVLAGQVGVDIYRDEPKDAVKAAKAAYARAKAGAYDTLIVDTSGRLQIDEELMAELARIKAEVKPDESLFVADSMTGQSAADVAKAFDEKIGITGVVLTKFDSDARGGAALSVKTVTGKPVKFIGVGEKPDGLEPFYPERVASRILGMGDIVSLVEKAQANIDQEEAEELQRKMAKETFDFQDYLDQIRRVRKMGSIKSMIEMMPGLAGQVGDQDVDEDEMKREEAIILSMTAKERGNPMMIGQSRRGRIARGSGTSSADVNHFLKKFEKTRIMMRKVAKNKKLQGQLMGGGPR
jgi:signal recognition particle subunit SRP54